MSAPEGPGTARVVDLLGWVGAETLDEASAARVTRRLTARGLRPEPSLRDVLADNGEALWGAATYDEPGVRADSGRLAGAHVNLEPARAPALQGAILVTLIAASVGYYRWEPYGLLLLLTGLLVSVAIGLRWEELDRRLPVSLSRGHLLGALAVTAGLAVALAAFIGIRVIA